MSTFLSQSLCSQSGYDAVYLLTIPRRLSNPFNLPFPESGDARGYRQSACNSIRRGRCLDSAAREGHRNDPKQRGPQLGEKHNTNILSGFRARLVPRIGPSTVFFFSSGLVLRLPRRKAPIGTGAEDSTSQPEKFNLYSAISLARGIFSTRVPYSVFSFDITECAIASKSSFGKRPDY